MLDFYSSTESDYLQKITSAPPGRNNREWRSDDLTLSQTCKILTDISWQACAAMFPKVICKNLKLSLSFLSWINMFDIKKNQTNLCHDLKNKLRSCRT